MSSFNTESGDRAPLMADRPAKRYPCGLNKYMFFCCMTTLFCFGVIAVGGVLIEVLDLWGEIFGDGAAGIPSMPQNGTNGTIIWVTTVPICGAAKSQCWEQIAGTPDIIVTKQEVSSPIFPCRSGKSATTWGFETANNITCANGDCASSCTLLAEGLGGSSEPVGLCRSGAPTAEGLYVGIDCPQGGTFEAVGKELACSRGIGSYIITLTCPGFTTRTYLSY